VLAVAALAGAVRLWRGSGRTACFLAVAGYLALLLVWNYAPDQRFLTPVFPVLLAGLFVELRQVAGKLRLAFQDSGIANRAAAGVISMALTAVSLAALAGSLAGLFQTLPRFLAEHRARRARLQLAYRWIAANTPEDAAVLAYLDPVLYLHTGRKACRFVVPTSLAYAGHASAWKKYFPTVAQYTRENGLSYVVLTSQDLHAELSDQDRLTAQAVFRKTFSPRLLYESGEVSVRAVDF